METRSKEFYEGFHSKAYLNPYPPASNEYDEFERGWTQRLKRGLPIHETKFEGEVEDSLTLFKSKNRIVKVESTKKKSFNELLTYYGIENKIK